MLSGRQQIRVVLILVLVGMCVAYAGLKMRIPSTPVVAEKKEPEAPVSRMARSGRLNLFWGPVPKEVRNLCLDSGSYSNIEPEDYVGAEKCASCHEDKFKSWSKHPHRFMNASATPDIVRGDFSDGAHFSYLGGEGRFWRTGDKFNMSVERGAIKRRFDIHRTIGSRYFQYYIGVQTEGPEPPGDRRYRIDHVLPFGYWLTKGQWVPTVHISDEERNEVDYDDSGVSPYENFYFMDYDRSCSVCHTTAPVGDWLLNRASVAGVYSPFPVAISASDYLSKQKRTPLADDPQRLSSAEFDKLLADLAGPEFTPRIVHLGIQCEACHNGCREHLADPEHVMPHFFPTSSMLAARVPSDNPYGRTQKNVNFICARCHSGERPSFPGGIFTWNSVEYSDAMHGSCYSELRCVDCHDPHRATGQAWSHTPDHDDGLCLKCHKQYAAGEARKAHTHHPAGSEGDRCMNCHMPKIDEGMDQLVRTHTIFSPTKRQPIEENGPNACNLCHLDRTIDWTVGNLKEWYGKEYDDAKIAKNYPQRSGPVGYGWLRHPFQATRLVAASTYGRQRRTNSLPVLLEILDDKFLLNRQFGQMAVEAVCGRSLEALGYRFSMSPQERAAVLPRVRTALTGAGAPR